MFNKIPFVQYTTKEIKPTGWLKEQLIVQANGLSGHLQECWPDIAQSQWIGGDREGWERVPYWLDGFIPLAYLLEDEKLIAVAKKYVDFIIEKQISKPDEEFKDGWICPVGTQAEFEAFDEWAVFLICKALIVYHDCSGDERIPNVIYKILKNLNFRLDHFAVKSWGSYRWYEALISIYWMYDRCGEDWLLYLVRNLWEQSADYHKIFMPDSVRTPNCWNLREHVVNLAMAIKCDALFAPAAKTMGMDIDRDEFAEFMYQFLLKNHGTAFGHFTGDECIAGDSPVHGTELCGVVEAMYSYEWLYASTAKEKWIERTEQLAFNALPASISEDMWVRQYNQMSNQIYCGKYDENNRPFRTNGIDGSLFGLESNYGCCTANFNQGWPKFALSTFFKSENGIACGAIAPSVLNTKIKDVDVKVEIVTGYPFKDTIKYIITTDSPVEFDFTYRVPSTITSAKVNGVDAVAGLHTITKTWSGVEEIVIDLVQKVEFVARPRDMYALYRGPVCFTLPIGEKWEILEYEDEGVVRKFPYCDYNLTATTEWQYEFASKDVEFKLNDDWKVPFTKAQPPIVASVDMYKIDWGYEDTFEGRVARITPKDTTPIGDKIKLELLPYGIPKLHMTEMPIVEK